MKPMTRIKMLKTTVGTRNGGRTIEEFEAGEEYDVPPHLAALFENRKACLVAKSTERFEYEESDVEVPEPKKDPEPPAKAPLLASDPKPGLEQAKNTLEKIIIADPPPEPPKPPKPRRKGRKFSVSEESTEAASVTTEKEADNV